MINNQQLKPIEIIDSKPMIEIQDLLKNKRNNRNLDTLYFVQTLGKPTDPHQK